MEHVELSVMRQISWEVVHFSEPTVRNTFKHIKHLYWTHSSAYAIGYPIVCRPYRTHILELFWREQSHICMSSHCQHTCCTHTPGNKSGREQKYGRAVKKSVDAGFPRVRRLATRQSANRPDLFTPGYHYWLKILQCFKPSVSSSPYLCVSVCVCVHWLQIFPYRHL